MKTGELVVEQVLIGGLVLLVLWLGLVASPASVLPSQPWGSLFGGALLLGAAYLLGIVFDRLADTLTEGLEAHHRLRFALTTSKHPPAPTSDAPWQDPFPENVLHARALNAKEAVVRWLDYHRSRIRLSRALAVYGPALTVAAVLASLPALDTRVPKSHGLWMLVVLAIYCTVPWRSSRKPAPKTFHPEAYAYGDQNGFFGDHAAGEARRRSSLRGVLMTDAGVQGALLVLLLAFAVALASGALLPVVAALAGALLTVLSGWSWWRISSTYREFLRRVGSELPKG